MPKNDVNRMSLQQLQEVPAIDQKFWNDEHECRTLIIVPSRHKHDSGYRMMHFVLEPVDYNTGKLVRVVGPTDVVHINGIGGLGKGWTDRPEGLARTMVPATGWQFDMLWASKCLRLFIIGGDTIIVGPALSSLEIWPKPKTAATVAT